MDDRKKQSRWNVQFPISLLTRPGVINFLLFLAVWYLFISLYIPSGKGFTPLERYLYYTKFSWPNFVLSYLMFIAIIPYYLHRRAYRALVLVSLGVMVLFVLIRYVNNLFWDPEYYSDALSGSADNHAPLLRILLAEFFRVFQFTMVAFAFRFYLEWRLGEENKSKLEYEKLKAELSGLRYRMNPHFLLNSMNNIYYLSMVNSSQTPQAIMKLSELLRYTLHEKEERVLLKRELEHLHTFLDFHLIRFSDYQLDVQEDVPEKFHLAMVPPLLFITFAENAFKHGDSDTGGAPIRIRITVKEQQLHYRVENRINQQGSSLEKTHTGLVTLQKRLFLHYGNDFQMRTEARDSIFTAELSLPL